jgi:hypothetical protein
MAETHTVTRKRAAKDNGAEISRQAKLIKFLEKLQKASFAAAESCFSHLRSILARRHSIIL